ncbi:hypothetical protein TVAG_302490 [Trichomonas vaginalis G3]|uniref:Uncharacterized protein n=1 Tax=Trichomonas vaginalis (strain ATCC PRA-98 / G3) TaxID=412133 RepID=A2EGS4_TRIV3|nr:hypothetical protein TVAGG3_0172800 [Trichomonas vaginalis G3]EAY08162.1 hypothetical protein TVAG_302490 [Trichomonas vaginalis G3]KAI5548706.1 hypothetical protein TVAGG3_0172800 [Trichomonas vaginalis G3]|eukprot:XP_001320385.1 hypothetical protein [Trichomonas vaginalis G3]
MVTTDSYIDETIEEGKGTKIYVFENNNTKQYRTWSDYQTTSDYSSHSIVKYSKRSGSTKFASKFAKFIITVGNYPKVYSKDDKGIEVVTLKTSFPLWAIILIVAIIVIIGCILCCVCCTCCCCNACCASCFACCCAPSVSSPEDAKAAEV